MPRDIPQFYFDDLHVGQVFELGSITVSEEEMLAFAQHYDPQPFHLSIEQARETPFGGLIASGWQTGSLFMRLLAERFLNQTISLASPGIDELRWLKPVQPGDILRGRCTILSCTPSRSRPEMGVVRTHCEFINQHDEQVMTLQPVNFIGRRPHEQ
jgi:acyl dehydratase